MIRKRLRKITQKSLLIFLVLKKKKNVRFVFQKL